MHRGRSRPSLGERAADSGVRPPPAPPLSTSPTPDPPPRQDGAGRHCWVHAPPGAPGTVPGLLVEWRQRPEGWQGRVAYAVPGPHGPVLVEAWLPAGSLQQR
ncbi:hypothetical protein SAMN05660690_3267 [Geodermatophilus telluris]|uniref:Uncharacterized protein n=1 Tax=Geodermatophilus telluris TaxID=1190417 RepID=A0A1G6RP68_9ACTN|nr:hypothetical protein [Geodermatophilus telluris]SDD06154.1 hypothetical protein SAMN05660690_3267 [Geodermatophilus telluris]